jgi:hypothetical protein
VMLLLILCKNEKKNHGVLGFGEFIFSGTKVISHV